MPLGISPLEILQMLRAGTQDWTNFVRGGRYSREQEAITRGVVQQATDRGDQMQQDRLNLAENQYGQNLSPYNTEQGRYITDQEAIIQNYRDQTTGTNSMRATADADSATWRGRIDENLIAANKEGESYKTGYLASVDPYYQKASASADTAEGAALADRDKFQSEYDVTKADTLGQRDKLTSEYGDLKGKLEFSSAKEVASQTAGIWSQAGVAMGNLMAQSGTMDPAQFQRAQTDLMRNFSQQAADQRSKASEAALNATATAKAAAFSAWSGTTTALTQAADSLYGTYTAAMEGAGNRLVSVANTRTALAANYGSEVEKASAVLKAAGVDYSSSLASWGETSFREGLSATAADKANEGAIATQLTALNDSRQAMEFNRIQQYSGMIDQAYTVGDSWQRFAQESRLGYRKMFNDLDLSNVYGTTQNIIDSNAQEDAAATAARHAQQAQLTGLGVQSATTLGSSFILAGAGNSGSSGLGSGGAWSPPPIP